MRVIPWIRNRVNVRPRFRGQGKDEIRLGFANSLSKPIVSPCDVDQDGCETESHYSKQNEPVRSVEIQESPPRDECGLSSRTTLAIE